MYGRICGKGKEREVIRQQAARAVREKTVCGLQSSCSHYIQMPVHVMNKTLIMLMPIYNISL